MAVNPNFQVKLASTPDDLRAAQHLRYNVFVRELGSDGPMVDHEAMIEADSFDGACQHLLLLDCNRGGDVRSQTVGVYRVMNSDGAAQRGGFYSETEFDLSVLTGSGRQLVELGRSCLHPDYRGGQAMAHLWQGVARLVDDLAADILFGVASFHGVDIAGLSQPLSWLHHNHLCTAALRVTSVTDVSMALLPIDEVDKIAALRATPALIKAYLRLGGMVGDGVYVDEAFNTTDVCMVLDTKLMNARARAIYDRKLT